jgi:hypothetical protein
MNSRRNQANVSRMTAVTTLTLEPGLDHERADVGDDQFVESVKRPFPQRRFLARLPANCERFIKSHLHALKQNKRNCERWTLKHKADPAVTTVRALRVGNEAARMVRRVRYYTRQECGERACITP